MEKEKPIGEATAEQIKEWKETHKNVFAIKVDDADGHALAMPPFLQNMLKNPQMFAMGPFGAIQPPPGQQTPQPAQPPQQEEPSRRAGRKKEVEAASCAICNKVISNKVVTKRENHYLRDGLNRG